MSPILGARGGLSASAYGFTSGVVGPGDYESIQTVTLTSAQTTVTFSSIASNYTHLQIRAFQRGNRAVFPVSDAIMRFNSDTGSNYAEHSLFGGGATAQASGSGTKTSINYGQPGTAVTNFAGSIIDVLDYANTNKYKTARALTGIDVNGTIASYGGTIGIYSGLWMNTAAITSISFTTGDGSDWQQYSSFALYGIK